MVPIAIAIYLAVVILVSLHYNISLGPDRIALLLVLAALGTGRVRLFFKDWSIFIIVLLAWQGLTSVTRHIGGFKPHVGEMIAIDRFLFFGQVPTIWLQEHLYHPGPTVLVHARQLYEPAWTMVTVTYSDHLRWYDIAATCFYLLHFVFPMLVAFALWYSRRAIFLEFMVAFLVLALAGFATNILFPAAPPWIAANWWHQLPHVHRILRAGIQFFGGNGNYSALYIWLWNNVGWDPVAAVPSEHAAFPFLCFLYGRLAWGRISWLILAYCFGVFFSIVYLGEHYVTDAIAGVMYAGAAYALVRYLSQRRAAQEQERGRTTAVSGAAS